MGPGTCGEGEMAASDDLQSAPRIEPDAAHDLLVRDGAAFVDVRTPFSYERSHIPGALSVPVADLPRRLDAIPRGGPVIAYCG